MLRIGNVLAAREMLEPLVAQRHPEALSELGRTFDPVELTRFQLVAPGMARAERARELYLEAAELGSATAKTRLLSLEQWLRATGKPVD